MKYASATEVLPKRLLEEVLRYANGCMLYLPKAEGTRRAWGETTGARRALDERNARIKKEHADGASLYELSERFFLSPDTIRKILYRR